MLTIVQARAVLGDGRVGLLDLSADRGGGANRTRYYYTSAGQGPVAGPDLTRQDFL